MNMLKKWQGRWNDGQTATSHEVEITLNEDTLTIILIDNPTAPPHFWSYKKIHAPVAIKPKSENVLLTNEDNPGQRLFINHADFAKRILEFAPNITAKSHNWALLKWPLAMAASLVFFWALTYFNFLSPAAAIANLLPDKARISLGEGVIRTIRTNKKTCQSPEGTAALNKLVQRLNRGVETKVPFKFQVIDLNMVNAFAAPGEQIIISGKLLQKAANADEVAGVLAHEMGHAIKRHPETNIVRALGLMAALQLFTAGESGAFGEIAFYFVQSGYSRAAESEADIYAAKIMKKATIDSRPLAGFFDRIITAKKKKKKKDNTKTKDKAETAKQTASPTTTEKKSDDTFIEWISTHPSTRKRIDYFNQTKIKTTPEILNKAEWEALSNICGKPEDNAQKKQQKKQ